MVDKDTRQAGDAEGAVAEPTASPFWTVVLRGRFNPAIFQPAWLAAQGLIRQEEADRAKGVVFAPDLVLFTADWLRLHVDEDRFEARTSDSAHAGPLRDLVSGIFSLLEHTPFEKMGLNHAGHYLLSEGQWSVLDNELAPKASWGGIMAEPRLRSLTIQGTLGAAPGARFQVKVEPSVRVEGAIFVATNEHYERSGPDAGRELMQLLSERWEGAQAYARYVVESLTARRKF